MNLMDKEIIICSAILVESTGKLFRGHRHNNCFDAMSGELSWSMTRKEISSLNVIQGFMTSSNRFVGRKEGLEIALLSGQVLDIGNIRNGQLYSEDLW